MRLQDVDISHMVGNPSNMKWRHRFRHGMAMGPTTVSMVGMVGGNNSLPPWSRQGLTYGEWMKKNPTGIKPNFSS